MRLANELSQNTIESRRLNVDLSKKSNQPSCHVNKLSDVGQGENIAQISENNFEAEILVRTSSGSTMSTGFGKCLRIMELTNLNLTSVLARGVLSHHSVKNTC